MSQDTSPNTVLHLNPYCKTRQEQAKMRTNFTILQRNYIILVCLSGAIVLYFCYSSSLLSISIQYKLLTGKGYRILFDRNLRSNESSSSHDDLSNPNAIDSASSLKLRKDQKTAKRSTKMACNIPVLNPFDQSMLKYNTNPPPANCTAGHPLIFTTDLESNLIQLEDPSEYGYTECCYQTFSRGVTDKKIELDPKCSPIKNKKTKMSKSKHFIRINCTKNADGNYTSVIVDYFAFVHLRSSVEKRVQKILAGKVSTGEDNLGQVTESVNSDVDEAQNVTTPERTLNVVILGIDAVAHMNFIRTMPLTHAYITKKLFAIGFDGYVKVADNTFPNMIPALTGQSVNNSENSCWRGKPFDTCPFIWKNYKARGYRTAYGEDAVWMGIFNFNKKGFKKIPTDYYNPHMTYQQEEYVGHHGLMMTPLCYGPRQAFEVSLDFLKKMAFTMNKTRRYFQFIWATGMTHDYLHEAKVGDKPLLETLQWFQNGGYLEDTAFILMSDHGLRWGGQRSTLQGRLEERMPFLYIMFPEWFKEKYRPAVSNMIRNRKKLTTPFDFHQTLLDLSDLGTISGDRIYKRYEALWREEKLPRGISLFLPIPERRNCEDADIADHYCVCRTMKSIQIENNTLVQEAARSVVHHINGMFIRFPQCMILSLKEILNAQVFQSGNSKVNDVAENITRMEDPLLATQQVTYSLTVTVLPSNATFEATTTRHTDGLWHVSGEVSRTNVYGDQSICVTDYNLKKFCYCY